MKCISYWASRHIWPARLAIVCGFAVLNALALLTGWLLHDLALVLPSGLVYLLVLPAAFAWYTYPPRHAGAYAARKLREALVIAVSYLQLVCLANSGGLIPSPVQELGASQPTMAQTASLAPLGRPAKTISRKNLRARVRAFRKSFRDRSPGEQAALIALAVVAAIGLLYLLAALSCSIACAGSETLAVFVAVLGSGLIIFLLVRVVQSITGRRAKPVPRTEKI